MARMNAIDEVAKKSNETAKAVVLKFIADEDLIDHPENRESVENTIDLETSMRENGFTTPLEITNFGAPEGKYMIMSGHRRRRAGRKVGITAFPCIIKPFSSAEEVKNYMLMANSQRDSDNEPLLRVNRYLMHQEYLKSIGFKGDERKEIADRMGLSVAQADRYKRFSRIISPVWDMVKAGRVGMSSVLQMAAQSEANQNIMYTMLCDAEAAGKELTRNYCENVIFAAFAEGKQKFSEIDGEREQSKKTELHDSGLPLNAFVNTEPNESREREQGNRNSEVRREFDALAANADAMDSDRARWEEQQARNEESGGESAPAEKPEKAEKSEDEEQRENAIKLMAYIDKMSKVYDKLFKFDDKEQAELTLDNMSSAVKMTVDEMFDIARDYGLESVFTELVSDIQRKFKEYK